MRIKFQNIGVISKADIDISGITLLAGENDTGKSTVGKLLYSVIKGFNQNEEDFYFKKNESIRSLYQNILRILKDKNIEYNFLIKKEINRNWIDTVNKINTDSFDIVQKRKFNTYIKRLSNALDLEYKSFNSNFTELLHYLNNEFNEEIKSIYNNETSEVEITELDKSTKLVIDENNSFELTENIELYYNNCLYIESPWVLDNNLEQYITIWEDNERDFKDRTSQLKHSLVNKIHNFGEVIFENYVNEISNLINGEIVIDDFGNIGYYKNNHLLNLDNTATGIRSLGIIQLLLKNNRLDPKTLLIIDEPEVHLHPKWQVKFAEILVKLSKESSIPILLTSHSPYFIEALELYSKKYKYQDQTNFYFAKKDKNGLSAEIINVSENILPILDSISDAFYTLQDELNDEN